MREQLFSVLVDYCLEELKDQVTLNVYFLHNVTIVLSNSPELVNCADGLVVSIFCPSSGYIFFVLKGAGLWEEI